MTALTVVRAGLVALAIVALGFVPEVSVANPPSATGHGDFTPTGPGNDNQLRTISFSAIQRPNGKVAGQAEVHNRTTGVVVHMDIDCLNFPDPNTPNMVAFSGKVTNPPALAGQTFTFLAKDNGEGSNSPPDELSGPFPVACSGSFNVEMFPIQNGNIQVRPAAD